MPALLIILGLAFGLRFWSVGWGLPFAFHADEQKYMPIAVRMLEQGSPNPRYFENPPLLTYVYYLELLVLLAGGKLLGILNSAADIKAMLDFNPAPLYLAARMHAVLLGTATVLMTYWWGGGCSAGGWPLAGALLLAVAFLPVRDSHYAVNDVPATFLLMASFALAVSVYRLGDVGKGLVPFRTVAPDRPAAGDEPLPYVTGRPWVPYLLSGLLLGLATATKYNVGLGAAAIAAAHLLRYRSWAGLLDARSHLPLLAAAGAALGGFLLGNPYALLDYPAFMEGFSSQYGWAADPYSTSDTAIGPAIFRSLLVGMGPAALVPRHPGPGHPRSAPRPHGPPAGILPHHLPGLLPGGHRPVLCPLRPAGHPLPGPLGRLRDHRSHQRDPATPAPGGRHRSPPSPSSGPFPGAGRPTQHPTANRGYPGGTGALDGGERAAGEPSSGGGLQLPGHGRPPHGRPEAALRHGDPAQSQAAPPGALRRRANVTT